MFPANIILKLSFGISANKYREILGRITTRKIKENETEQDLNLTKTGKYDKDGNFIHVQFGLINNASSVAVVYNNYIYYEGVSYGYDESTNIIDHNYEELGKWNSECECVEWYNEECYKIHVENKNKLN